MACFLPALVVAAGATELIREDLLPNLGIGVYDRNDIRWRAKAIADPDLPTIADRVWTGPDLWQSEYGKPLDFSTDLITQYGYSSGAPFTVEKGGLQVTTGAQGFAFGFGGLPNDRTRPAILPGATWGANTKEKIRLQMVMEQDVPETKWRLSFASPDGYQVFKEFTIAGAGRHSFEDDVSLVWSVNDVWHKATGVKFECVTPNATLQIDSIKMAPSSANAYYRKEFTLSEKLIEAHASFNYYDVFDLYVNGKWVDKGNGLYPSAPLKTVDLTPYLKVGVNTIGFRREFVSWSTGSGFDSNSVLLFEGVSVARSGKVTRILSDDSWKTSYQASSGWMQVGYDDSSWKAARVIPDRDAPYMTAMWDKDRTAVPNGLDPKHMGTLDVVPANRKYPLFDDNEVAAFQVRLPAGMRGNKVRAEVYRAGTNDLVETKTVPAFKVNGDWSTAVVKFARHAVGPYRVVWTLRDGDGKVMETRPEEMLVIGPLPQPRVPLASFEKNLESRLQRVIHIDCTAPVSTGDRFLDHSGPYSTLEINKGRVTTANGLTYRETGAGGSDHFDYRLQDPGSSTPTLTRGKPYLVEVIVPDNRERAVYSAIIEARPIDYFNNGFAAGWPAATGAARLGGRYPNTGGWRKLRYIYYPSSAAAAVMVINTMGSARAAAREINIYSVKGGLPALEMPLSERGIGPHDERVTLNAVSFASESPLENAPTIALNAHRNGWYHWYRIYERKINLLRFQGFNMSIEGLYQYYEPSFPQKRGPWVSNDAIDLPFLAIKMNARNGIKTYLDIEYSFDPAMKVDSIEMPSDRRMWNGEPTIQAVDRQGRQLARGIWGNANFLHPTSKKYFNGLVKEIYNRYQAAGPVEGMHIATFGWLTPGFAPGGYGAYTDVASQETGYDDYTLTLFEKETGIKLGLGITDPKRFQKRYDLLNGPHRARWRQWRFEKVRQTYSGVSDSIRASARKWKLLVEPSQDANFVHKNPFASLESTPEQRARAFATLTDDIDMPVEMYNKLSHIAVAPSMTATAWQSHSPGDNVLGPHGLLSAPETGRAVEKMQALAMSGPLDELNPPVGAASRWLWTNGTAGVYIPRGVEDNAMNDFVDVLKNGIPRTIIYSWLDVNVESAFGPQLRRFNKSFAATPTETNFTPLPANQARGIIAQTAPRPGGLFLRLINASPYALSGSLEASATTARDLVYDANLTPTSRKGAAHEYSLSLKPNDIRIVTLNNAQASRLRLNFNLDKAATRAVLTQARNLLGSPNLSASIPEAKRKALQTAVTRGDGFGAYNILDSWEVFSVTSNAALFEKGPGNQKRFLETLARGEVARIDVGGSQEYRDEEGHVWLPDQAYLGARFYGFANGTLAERGDISIANTRSRKVYQTELYGDHLAYRLPVANGRYNLSLYFAETFAPFNQPGSRIFQVTMQGGQPETIDLVARAGGQLRAFVLTKSVDVTNGLIEANFGGNAKLDGISLEKVNG